jgi:hypothetical protein
MEHKALADSVSTIFIALAVLVGLVVGAVSYLSGCSPEWVVGRICVGLLAVGSMGWLLSKALRAEAPVAPVVRETAGIGLEPLLPSEPPVTSASSKKAAASDAATR